MNNVEYIILSTGEVRFGFSISLSPLWRLILASCAFAALPAARSLSPTSLQSSSSAPCVFARNGMDILADSDNNAHPVWSPDGSQVAFDSDRDGGSDIYGMDADGSNILNLTNRSKLDKRGSRMVARWQRIAFVSTTGSDSEIYIMNADGSDITQTTHSEVADDARDPRWSPDGSKIAFSSDSDGTQDIYVANVASLRTGSQPSIIPDASNR